MRKPCVRALLSTLLLLCCLLIIITGAALYFAKTGMVLGIPRITVRQVHAACSLVMSLAMITHFVLNWKIYCQEMRLLAKALRRRRGGKDGMK